LRAGGGRWDAATIARASFYHTYSSSCSRHSADRSHIMRMVETFCTCSFHLVLQGFPGRNLPDLSTLPPQIRVALSLIASTRFGPYILHRGSAYYGRNRCTVLHGLLSEQRLASSSYYEGFEGLWREQWQKSNRDFHFNGIT
jgi:hypothetical protein